MTTAKKKRKNATRRKRSRISNHTLFADNSISGEGKGEKVVRRTGWENKKKQNIE